MCHGLPSARLQPPWLPGLTCLGCAHAQQPQNSSLPAILSCSCRLRIPPRVCLHPHCLAQSPKPMHKQRTHHPQLWPLLETHWQMVWGMRLHSPRHPIPPLKTLKQRQVAALEGSHTAAGCRTARFADAAEGLPAGGAQQELAVLQPVNAYWAQPALRATQLSAGCYRYRRVPRSSEPSRTRCATTQLYVE